MYLQISHVSSLAYYLCSCLFYFCFAILTLSLVQIIGVILLDCCFGISRGSCDHYQDRFATHISCGWLSFVWTDSQFLIIVAVRLGSLCPSHASCILANIAIIVNLSNYSICYISLLYAYLVAILEPDGVRLVTIITDSQFLFVVVGCLFAVRFSISDRFIILLLFIYRLIHWFSDLSTLF